MDDLKRIKDARHRGQATLDKREPIITAERLVRDVMHRGVVTIDVDSPAREAVRLLGQYRVHALVVLDEMGEVCGVISNTDLLKVWGKPLASYTVEEIMTPNVISIAATALLDEAVEMMLEHKVHQLIVLKGEPRQRRAVGIVSRADVVREMVEA